MATRKNPEGPKARQVSVPSRNAAPIPERDKPETKIGDPKRNISALLRSADCHVAGDDWTRASAPPTASWMREACMVRGKRGRGLKEVGFGEREERGNGWKEEGEEREGSEKV